MINLAHNAFEKYSAGLKQKKTKIHCPNVEKGQRFLLFVLE